MRITIVSPGRPGLDTGNQVTARRWARLLRDLRHQVRVQPEYDGWPADVLVALHARKSFPSLEGFRRDRPGRAVIVALTGTDLYGDIRNSGEARRSLALADRLVLLQPAGLEELSRPARAKARVIHQSATRPRGHFPPRKDAFEVVVLAHLRAVKDPLRAAPAARLRRASSRLRVVHAGAALSAEAARAARREQASNPRYRWLGPLPRWRALRLLARARALVLSSRLEGGANVLSEAVACSVPVLCSRIPGSPRDPRAPPFRLLRSGRYAGPGLPPGPRRGGPRLPRRPPPKGPLPGPVRLARPRTGVLTAAPAGARRT